MERGANSVVGVVRVKEGKCGVDDEERGKEEQRDQEEGFGFLGLGGRRVS